jgi:hypothetical protein
MYFTYVLSISTDEPVGKFFNYEEALQAEKYLAAVFGEDDVFLKPDSASDKFDERWIQKINDIKNQQRIPSKMTSSLKRSLDVVNLIQRMLPDEIPMYLCFKNLDNPNKSKMTSSYYYIEAYQNGREQGFTVWATGFCFYICEARRTDSIGFYRGDFPESQGIGENAYSNGFNSFDTVKECAVTIAKAIQQFYGFDESLLVL